MSDKKMTWLNVRLPKHLKELMIRYVEMGMHNGLSELTRDALREKIKRDAPELYAGLFKEC